MAHDVRDRAMRKVDSMFFKVALIMDQLADKDTPSAVYAAIEASPQRLDAMIAHVLERVLAAEPGCEPPDLDDFREMLLWICFSKRPPYISELYGITRERAGR